MKNSKLRIIVSGLVGLYPIGGVAWDYFQYVTGLSKLGHDVYYHEDSWSWPFQPVENRYTSDGAYSARFISDFFERYYPGMSEKWHYLHLHEQDYGMSGSEFDEIAATADLFINVSGDCFFPRTLSPECKKIFIDTDPGYNQIMLSEKFAWSENVERWCSMVRDHDRHFTNAENINGPDCLVPKAGIEWKETGRPVDLDLWRPDAAGASRGGAPWSTVMTWNAFKGALVFNGIEYKSKGAEFEKIIDLPRQVDVTLQVAVGGKHAPLEWIAANGWRVLDGPRATLTPSRYQDLIAASRGEFSIAKHVYVAMRTGWFSYRSACYLASGIPVVVQDTGFSAHLPVGAGLLAFNTAKEAVGVINAVEAEHERHAAAAVEIAREHFDAAKVLAKLVDDAYSGS